MTRDTCMPLGEVMRAASVGQVVATELEELPDYVRRTEYLAEVLDHELLIFPLGGARATVRLTTGRPPFTRPTSTPSASTWAHSATGRCWSWSTRPNGP